LCDFPALQVKRSSGWRRGRNVLRCDVLPLFTRPLDRIAIRSACRTVPAPCADYQPTARREALRHPDYFENLPPGAPLEFYQGAYFTFGSPVQSAFPENNTVFGRLFRASGERGNGKRGPAVVLLHGWNGEQGYRYLFPFMGRRFASLGLTTAMIELPYHGSRKPRRGSLRNFLSGDLEHMMGATRQALADIRAMIRWLHEQGYGPVGVWGNSLGAWLGGLATCADERVEAAVLVTPVPRLDLAIETLDFCRHIKQSMTGREVSAAELNLVQYQPKCGARGVLIVESVYDLFASADSVEELWECWGRTDIWRVRHGHISVLFSPVVMEKTGRWLRQRLTAVGEEGGVGR